MQGSNCGWMPFTVQPPTTHVSTGTTSTGTTGRSSPCASEPRLLLWHYHNYSLNSKCEREYIMFDSTELNSRTSHQSEWLTRGKKLKQLIRIPDSGSDSLIFFLKYLTLLQRNNAAGRLFPASTILTEKKNIYVYLNEPVVYIL